jgi:hypothetical protein
VLLAAEGSQQHGAVEGTTDRGERRLSHQNFRSCRASFSKDAGIALQQVQSRFARLLCNARAKQDHAASGEVSEVAGVDFQGVRKGHGMPEVVGFRLSAGRVLSTSNSSRPTPCMTRA